MNSTLFFDLDGTLIDVRRRHLEVYHIVAARMNLPIISDEEYWERKRNRTFPWDDVPDEICQLFRKNFKVESELLSHLRHDAMFPDMKDLLIHIHNYHSLVLLTKRYSRENLLTQLDALNISSFFDDILTPNPGTKKDAVIRRGYTQQDSVIGDTEEDIITANELKLSSIAVTWGVRNNKFLESYKPTHIVSTISELYTLLQQR